MVGDPIAASLRALQEPALGCLLAAPLLLHVPPLGDAWPPGAATHASAGLVELQADGSSVTHFFDVVARDELKGKNTVVVSVNCRGVVRQVQPPRGPTARGTQPHPHLRAVPDCGQWRGGSRDGRMPRGGRRAHQNQRGPWGFCRRAGSCRWALGCGDPSAHVVWVRGGAQQLRGSLAGLRARLLAAEPQGGGAGCQGPGCSFSFEEMQ